MDESLRDVKAFAKEFKMNYPLLVGAGRDDLDDLEAVLGPIVRLPTAVLVDRAGRICLKQTGILVKDQIETVIRAAM